MSSKDDNKVAGQMETYVGNLRLLAHYAKSGISLSEISEPIKDKSATAVPVLFCNAKIKDLANYLRDGDSKLHRYSGIVALGGYACIDMNGQLSIFEYEIEHPNLARSQFLTNIWRIYAKQELTTHSDALHQWLDGHVSEFLLGPVRMKRMRMRKPDDQFFERVMNEARYARTAQRDNRS